MTPELQPYATFTAFNVPANQPTTIRLSGGKSIPFVFQLGVNSTIPYVRLLGSSGGQKLFSWTEKIIVPPGEMVTVTNGSYHPGDIWIQSGWDPAVIPARVTVPVALINLTNPPGDTARSAFALDTRRARRAFVGGFGATADPAGLIMNISIQARGRSHVSTPLPTEGGPPPIYSTTVNTPVATVPGNIPLGINAHPSDTVHDLLDTAEFFATANDVMGLTGGGAAHFLLEYV